MNGLSKAEGAYVTMRRFDAVTSFVTVALALLHAGLMAQLWVGDFFNSYHYISDDGFDWITQGVAFNQLVTGADTSVWPVLRQPVFVLVAAIDNAVGVPGLIFLLAQTGAVAATAYVIGRFARAKGLGAWGTASLILTWYFFVFGFYRLWVLSDTIAAAFMTISVVFGLAALERSDNKNALDAASKMLPAILATSLAGLTQT